VHFKNSTDLRDNDPEQKSHFRKLSNATINSETTELDAHNSDLVHKLSPESGVTAVHRQEASSSSPPDSSATKRKFKRKKGKVDEDAGKTAHQIELEQDRNLNPSPFSFRPFQLAHSLDPKSFDTIAAFNGTPGVLRGLGTRAEYGLSKESALSRSNTGQSLAGKGKAVDGPAPQHEQQPSATENEKEDNVPAITLTSPDGPTMTENSSLQSSEDGPASHASMTDRRRIYGENILPTRPSKTLLQLMWLALKDKVLILLSIAAVISLALGLFQDFGTPRPPGEPPVDWVEGVAIMVAVFIVVCSYIQCIICRARLLTQFLF
jgi:Ca2+-transporting ATPase